MNLSKRIKKLEQAVTGKDIPPLFISSYNDDEILGFMSGDRTCIRRPGESLECLKKRAVEKFQDEPGAVLCTAITEHWGNWPFMDSPTPDGWCKEYEAYRKNKEAGL